MIGFWLSIYGLFFATVCALKAKEKNRNTKNWFLAGFVFGLFGYIAIARMKDLFDGLETYYRNEIGLNVNLFTGSEV